MDKVVSAKDFIEKANQKLNIPGFENGEVITIKVKKPRTLAMMAEGKIPNPLMGAVSSIVRGNGVQQGKEESMHMGEFAQIIEFFCKVCMIEPTYEEVKEVITDEQMIYIFNWAMGGAQRLENFRKDKEDGPDNNLGKAIQPKAKRNRRN